MHSDESNYKKIFGQYEESSGAYKANLFKVSKTLTTGDYLESEELESEQSQSTQSSFQIDEYMCPDCGKGFINSENTTIQEFLHNNLIACDICNRYYHLYCCSEIYNEKQTGNFCDMVENTFVNSLNNNVNSNLDSELKKIENKLKLIPFFICKHCTETRQLNSICNCLNTNIDSKVIYYQDDIKDPFLFYERYEINDESKDNYYIICKVNNENILNKFSYSNHLATREDSRFLTVSKVTLQTISEYSIDLLELSIENTFKRFSLSENQSINRQIISINEYKDIGFGLIKTSIENCNIRPEIEVYTLLKINATTNLSECIGYFTCSFNLTCNQSKKKEIATCNSILRQLFISEKFRKKGHAQKMIKFFFNLSNLLQTISDSENYRFFSKSNCVEYPNYSMCSLLLKLNRDNLSKIIIPFDWNDILEIKEKTSQKKRKIDKSELNSSTLTLPNIEKRKFQIQNLIKETLLNLKIEYQSKKLIAFIFKITNTNWRAEVFVPSGLLDFDIIDDKEMKIEFEW